MNNVVQKSVRQTICKHKLLNKTDKVLIALSGGADSVALLRVMLQLGYKVEALHCNFHLRGDESDRDEQFVRELCNVHDVPLHCKHFDTKQYCKDKKISIEMGARELRYTWFQEMYERQHANAICVAHHKQDQAETILLNLVRGTGIRGLAGMNYRNGNVVRPMLECTRKEIEEYLNSLQQGWNIDSTNLERDAMRNIIRLDVIPLLQTINPKAIENISKSANHIRESLVYYEKGVNRETTSEENVEAEKSKFGKSVPQTDEIHALSETELFEKAHKYGFNSTMIKNIWEGKNGAIIMCKDYRLLKSKNSFILRRNTYCAEAPKIETMVTEREHLTQLESGVIYLDYEKALLPLKTRKVKPGDRFKPVGMKGSKLVSDLLTDLKLNRYEKEDQYVLTDINDNIVWVIGRRSANLYTMTDSTQKVLCIREIKD